MRLWGLFSVIFLVLPFVVMHVDTLIHNLNTAHAVLSPVPCCIRSDLPFTAFNVHSASSILSSAPQFNYTYLVDTDWGSASSILSSAPQFNYTDLVDADWGSILNTSLTPAVSSVQTSIYSVSDLVFIQVYICSFTAVFIIWFILLLQMIWESCSNIYVKSVLVALFSSFILDIRWFLDSFFVYGYLNVFLYKTFDYSDLLFILRESAFGARFKFKLVMGFYEYCCYIFFTHVFILGGILFMVVWLIESYSYRHQPRRMRAPVFNGGRTRKHKTPPFFGADTRPPQIQVYKTKADYLAQLATGDLTPWYRPPSWFKAAKIRDDAIADWRKLNKKTDIFLYGSSMVLLNLIF